MAAILSNAIRFLTCGCCCAGEPVTPLPIDALDDSPVHAPVDDVAEAVSNVAVVYLRGAAEPAPHGSAERDADALAAPPQQRAEVLEHDDDSGRSSAPPSGMAHDGSLARPVVEELAESVAEPVTDHADTHQDDAVESSPQATGERVADAAAAPDLEEDVLEGEVLHEDGSSALDSLSYSHPTHPSQGEDGSGVADEDAPLSARPDTPSSHMSDPRPEGSDGAPPTAENMGDGEALQPTSSIRLTGDFIAPDRVASTLARKYYELSTRFNGEITALNRFIATFPESIHYTEISKRTDEALRYKEYLDELNAQLAAPLRCLSPEDISSLRSEYPEVLPFFTLYDTVRTFWHVFSTYAFFLNSVCTSYRSKYALMYPDRITLPESLRETMQSIRAGECFLCGEEIGRGGFGFVKKVTLGEQKYAMKCMILNEKDGTRFADEKISFLREAALAEIATLFALPRSFFLTRPVLALAQPEEAVSLFPKAQSNFLNVLKKEPMPVTRFLPLLGDIVQGLFALHTTKVLLPDGQESRGIVHCDLKFENLLLFEDSTGEQHLKITDFGLTGIAGQKCLGGTPVYRAPESFEKKSTLDPKMDIWSLGIIAASLLFNRSPFSKAFQDSSDPWTQELIDEELNKRVKLKEVAARVASEDSTGDALRFIYRCLRVNPEERPTVEEVAEDPFIRPGLRSRLGEDPRDVGRDAEWLVHATYIRKKPSAPNPATAAGAAASAAASTPHVRA